MRTPTTTRRFVDGAFPDNMDLARCRSYPAFRKDFIGERGIDPVAGQSSPSGDCGTFFTHADGAYDVLRSRIVPELSPDYAPRTLQQLPGPHLHEFCESVLTHDRFHRGAHVGFVPRIAGTIPFSTGAEKGGVRLQREGAQSQPD